jgi:hypothetical protein
MVAYATPFDLADALKDAARAHHLYEQKTGKPDPQWAEWYALYTFRKAHPGQPDPSLSEYYAHLAACPLHDSPVVDDSGYVPSD